MSEIKSWKLVGDDRCVKAFGPVLAPCGCEDADQMAHTIDPGTVSVGVNSVDGQRHLNECLGCGAVWCSYSSSNWEHEDDFFDFEMDTAE